MEFDKFLDRVSDLSDLELACLLCLVAKQHCLIETIDELLDDVVSEIALIASEVFGLSYVVLSLEDIGSVENFGNSILEHVPDERENASEFDGDEIEAPQSHSSLIHAPGLVSRHASLNPNASRHPSEAGLDARKVINVIIAKDFNLAPEDVQIQALDLIRRRRIFSHTTVHTTQETFLFIPLISSSSKHIRLNKYLNDRIFISHFHDPDDGFPNLEELDGAVMSDAESASSVVRYASKSPAEFSFDRRINWTVVEKLRVLGDATMMNVDVRRYLNDIVVFLRIERGVAGGVSPYATELFASLAKYLAPLHGIDFVTPSLVTLAAKKIYPHRIVITAPEKERSVQYGSDLNAVRELVAQITPETVIETVVNTVSCPL